MTKKTEDLEKRINALEDFFAQFKIIDAQEFIDNVENNRTGSIPLIAGFTDKTTILPITILQAKVDDLEKRTIMSYNQLMSQLSPIISMLDKRLQALEPKLPSEEQIKAVEDKVINEVMNEMDLSEAP